MFLKSLIENMKEEVQQRDDQQRTLEGLQKHYENQPPTIERPDGLVDLDNSYISANGTGH